MKGNKLPESNLFKISTLNSQRVSSMLFPLAKYFIFKKPDLVFTAGDHLNAIVLIASAIVILRLRHSDKLGLKKKKSK